MKTWCPIRFGKSVVPLMLLLMCTCPAAAAIHFVPYAVDDAFEGAVEVSVIDMDGDGDLDMAGAAFDGDEICWWENDGSQSFTRHVVETGFGGWPRSVRAADEEGNLLDFDGDGDVDLLAACWTSNRVYWWENDGSFTFTRHEVGPHNRAHTAVARDVDRDGDLDVVCTGNPLNWYENNGSQTFTSHTISVDNDLGQNVRALDLDDDGDIDIIEARGGETGPRIWINNGSQQFTSHSLDPDFDECHFAEPADPDQDGDRDYIGASNIPGEFSWWENDGGGLTKHVIDDTLTASAWISMADFDNDGDQDFAGSTFGGYAAAWWENDGAMGLTMHELDGHFDGYCLVPVDLDQDGRIDLVGAGRGDDAVIWWRNMEATGAKILVGPGPGPDNAPLVRLYPPINWPEQETEFSAYGAPYFGVNVAVGDLDGNGVDEILTGPGPGSMYGPHVRGFAADGTPLSGVSFLAYGTPKWGVNVCSGDIDGDGFDEIITGAGPGAVFGPHVRAFDSDGGPSVSPVPGVSYFAYGTLKWGVNVASGDIDGDGFDEIVTGAGPGTVFGPHVRGWNVDGGPAVAIGSVSYMAYGTNLYGVNVTCGDVDGDGIDEIVTGPGPGAVFGAHLRGWNVDGGTPTPLPGFSFFAWPADERRGGATVSSGRDLSGDGRDEILSGLGPMEENRGHVRVWRYTGSSVEQVYEILAFTGPFRNGANAAAGRF